MAIFLNEYENDSFWNELSDKLATIEILKRIQILQ